VRNETQVQQVQAAHPDVSAVLGNLDDVDLMTQMAEAADIVLRMLLGTTIITFLTSDNARSRLNHPCRECQSHSKRTRESSKGRWVVKVLDSNLWRNMLCCGGN
jgi:hypothetical protein